MGMIEVEIMSVAKLAIKDPVKLEPLFSKLALIIERQAMGLKGMEWHKESLDRAKALDQELFHDIQKMKQDLNPNAENSQATKSP